MTLEGGISTPEDKRRLKLNTERKQQQPKAFVESSVTPTTTAPGSMGKKEIWVSEESGTTKINYRDSKGTVKSTIIS